MADELSREAVGARLRLIRIALNLETQGAMAQRLGANSTQYQNWEGGTAMIPVPYATRLHAMSGFTLDYLFRGDTSSLPIRLVTLLEGSQERFAQGG